MKEIDVLGVKIKDFPLKELIKMATEYMSTPGVNTMSWLSANVLLSVSENVEEQMPWIEALDLMVCDQSGLLRSGRAAAQLHKDGKSEDFMENFFKYLGTNGASIAIIGDSNDIIERVYKSLREFSQRLNIISRYVITNPDDMDDLFNEINSDFPKVIITCVPWLIQGPLLETARVVSNGSLWISLLPEMYADNSQTMMKKNEAFFDRFIFGRRVANYQKQ